MIIYAEGRLKLNHHFVTDGVNWFKVLSPKLRHSMRLNKRDSSVVGKWISVNNWIIWFKKDNRKFGKGISSTLSKTKSKP